MRIAPPASIALLVAVVAILPLALNAQATNAQPTPQPVQEKKVLARVGDAVLTLADFERSIEALPADKKEKLTLERKKALVDDWVLTQLLAVEAQRRGIDQDEKVKYLLRMKRAEVLCDELLRRETAGVGITDEEVRQFFQRHKDKFAVPQTAHLGLITVRTSDEANKVLQRLLAGEDFAAVAKEVSIDKFRAAGGDMGVIAKSDKLPEFIKAAFYLRPGSLSDVVRSKQGFCILKLFEKKPGRVLNFEELSPKLKKMLVKKALREKKARIILALKRKVEKQVPVERNLELLAE